SFQGGLVDPERVRAGVLARAQPEPTPVLWVGADLAFVARAAADEGVATDAADDEPRDRVQAHFAPGRVADVAAPGPARVPFAARLQSLLDLPPQVVGNDAQIGPLEPVNLVWVGLLAPPPHAA